MINWFKNLKNKKKLKFIIFDVENFYPSIDDAFLLKSIEWSKNFIDFPKGEIETILAARMATLNLNCEPWSKKEGFV